MNGDGKSDVLFVLHEADPHNVLKRPMMAGETIDTNPRILAVAFHDATGDGYTLAMQNSKLIPRWTELSQDDNFPEDGEGLKIARGAFTVTMGYFSNMGGWDTGQTHFTFRWQHGRFELIGFENENTNRGTLDDTDTSANYSTGKVVIVHSNENSSKTRTVTKVLPHKPLRSMDEVGDGMEFEIPE